MTPHAASAPTPIRWGRAGAVRSAPHGRSEGSRAMLRLIAVFCATVVAGCALSACGGGSAAHFTPHGGLPATPSPVPTGAGSLSAVQVNSALAGVATTYATLPHTNPVSDISALAASMVASGAFSTAAATPGGITATLPDGSLALVFADVPEEVGVKGTAARSQHASSVSSAATRGSAGAQQSVESRVRLSLQRFGSELQRDLRSGLGRRVHRLGLQEPADR